MLEKQIWRLPFCSNPNESGALCQSYKNFLTTNKLQLLLHIETVKTNTQRHGRLKHFPQWRNDHFCFLDFLWKSPDVLAHNSGRNTENSQSFKNISVICVKDMISPQKNLAQWLTGLLELHFWFQWCHNMTEYMTSGWPVVLLISGQYFTNICKYPVVNWKVKNCCTRQAKI